MTEYTGVLVFHSETGTEGGYWAFQDEQFMGLDNKDKKCTRCGVIWPDDDETEPKAWFTYWVEDKAHYMVFHEPQDLPLAKPGRTHALEKKWNAQRNEIAWQCHTRGHEGWEPLYPNGMWSYEGLHVLHNGDELTIYSKDDPDEVIWQGTVEIDSQDPYGTDSADLDGLAIHSTPKGIDTRQWGTWFINEHPAKLVTHD